MATEKRAVGKWRLRALLLVLASLPAFSSEGASAAPANACESEIARAAARWDVPIGILYSVGLAETGRKGSLQPNALNIGGKAVFPASREEAIRLAEAADRQGIRLVDIGCMQINRKFHGQAFAGLDDMLDPGRNVEYAARFLAQLKARHETWVMAVARYHAGPNNDPAQKQYVCRVIANLVAAGFGNWTPNARSFCNP